MLNRVKQAPTTNATQMGLTTTPSIIFVVAKTAIEIKSQCNIIFIPLEAGRGRYYLNSNLLKLNN